MLQATPDHSYGRLRRSSKGKFEFRFPKLSRLPFSIGRENTRKRTISVFIAEGPPVPIPNTEVKLCYGEDTYLETSRENSSMLMQNVRE